MDDKRTKEENKGINESDLMEVKTRRNKLVDDYNTRIEEKGSNLATLRLDPRVYKF